MWRRMRAFAGLMALLVVGVIPGSAQTFEAVGTRAQGMGGAFVGMADDASAVYWNPGGLARGAYFSLVLDGSGSEAVPDPDRLAADRGGWLLALTTPALGVSYYRLRSVTVRPSPPSLSTTFLRFNSLVTHHVGATLVQSLTDGIAVGATVKLIRGEAASVAAAEKADDLLDGWDVMGRTANKVDVDVGVMATGGIGSVGLTVRNLSEPAFRTGDDLELRLERQIRGGASVLLLPTWKLAADFDFTTSEGPFTDVRELALGTEGRLTRRLTARGGFRLNTAGDRGRAPSVSLGGSYAVLGSLLLDAQVTRGGDEAFGGWGIAGRMVF